MRDILKHIIQSLKLLKSHNLERIIIIHLYMPGSAATNRILAYALAFSSQGVNVSLILGNQILHDPPLFDKEKNISAYMVQAPHGYNLNRAMANKVEKLNKGASTAVLIYGTPALCWFLPKSKYNIFYECTEVPFYGRKKTFQSWVKEKIKVYLAKRATGMLVISKALVNYFKEQGIKNITVVNMFVDFKRFENVKTDAKEKYIAYCGTISPFKDGVDCLIKAFACFASSHSDYKLKIIGRFESADAEKTLKGLVESLNVVNSVEFTGVVKPEEMPQLLCGAQMLALARPDNEQAKYGFPTKLGEYLATGKPVVVTRVGEIGDFLKDGVNCRMSEPENPEAFADCMSWVADHYESALSLGEAGRQLTMDEFSSYRQSKKALAFMDLFIQS